MTENLLKAMQFWAIDNNLEREFITEILDNPSFDK